MDTEEETTKRDQCSHVYSDTVDQLQELQAKVFYFFPHPPVDCQKSRTCTRCPRGSRGPPTSGTPGVDNESLRGWDATGRGEGEG